jgi:hypothetical protein
MIKLTDILTELILKEEEKYYHGTFYYFKCFRAAGIGGGAGSQIFGWGIYFGKDFNVAKSYSAMRKDIAKSLTLFQGKNPSEMAFEYDNIVFERIPSKLKTKEELIEYAKEVIELLEEDGDPEGLIPEYKRFIEIINELDIKNEGMSYVYEVLLHKGKSPDQYEYLDWDLQSTPQSQVDKINKQAQKEGWKDFYVSTEMSPGEIYKYINSYIINNKVNKYRIRQEHQISFPAGKDTSLFLLAAGIDGNTHGNGGVRIIFDEKAIEIINVCKMNYKK